MLKKKLLIAIAALGVALSSNALSEVTRPPASTAVAPQAQLGHMFFMAVADEQGWDPNNPWYGVGHNFTVGLAGAAVGYVGLQVFGVPGAIVGAAVGAA